MPSSQLIKMFTFLMFLLAPPAAGETILLLVVSRYVRRHGKGAGWGRILVVNLMSVFVLVTLTFLGGEVYYRYVYDTTDSLAYTKVSRQWVERYCSINHAGFRDNVEYLVERQPSKRRISFLGDSFTAGHGIKSVEDRFPNILRTRHPDWEVHVLAKFGLDTGAELGTLRFLRRAGYQFDQVVLVYCLNDIADLFPEWNVAVQALLADKSWGGWLREHSYFFDILYHRYKAATDPTLKSYYGFVREGYRGHLWMTQQQRLREIRDFVQANGGRLLVVTFPFLQLEGRSDYDYQFVHDQLNEFWRSLAVPHLDLQPLFARMPPERITVNRYDAHPNEFANSIVAEKVDAFLAEALKAAASDDAKAAPDVK